MASSPPTGTSGSAGFGMRSSRSSSSASAAASSASISSIRAPARGRGVAQRLDLGAVGLGAAADRLADLLAGGVALGLQRVRLRLEPAAARVDLDRPVDEARVLALVDRPLADPVRLLAEPLDADAHAIGLPDARAASRRRRMTKAAVEAREEPAGARAVGPAEEREVQGVERGLGVEAVVGGDGEDRGLPLLAGRRRVAVGGRLGEGPQVAALLGAELLGLDRQRVAPDLDPWPAPGRTPRASAGRRRGGSRAPRPRRRSAGRPSPPRPAPATSTPGTWTSSARCANAGRNARRGRLDVRAGSSSE